MTENSICHMTEQHMKLLSKCNSGTKEAPYKKKKEAAAYPSCGLSSLPDAVALSCLARVSKLDHPALSMVSKRYRSLMVSSELYDERSSSMGRTENLLYVCLRTAPEPTPRWFFHSPHTNDETGPDPLVTLYALARLLCSAAESWDLCNRWDCEWQA